MRYDATFLIALLLALTIAEPIGAQATKSQAAAVYSNEEQVYFATEMKRPVPLRINLLVVPTRQGIDKVPYSFAFVDAFGTEVFRPLPFADVAGQIGTLPLQETISLTVDGVKLELRRARPVTCWGSVPKITKKPDGTDDWYFIGSLKLHDQGGRVQFGGGNTGAPSVVLRMRNVVWPSGPNKPSLVLYVHKPETPDRAESYSWADPEAKRIGINLRWMQASCTVD